MAKTLGESALRAIWSLICDIVTSADSSGSGMFVVDKNSNEAVYPQMNSDEEKTSRLMLQAGGPP